MISVDDHRPQRPHAVGPDARRVLGLDRARAGRSASASTARSARARCGRTSPSSRASPTATSAAIPTPACRTPSAQYDEQPAETGGAACASSPTSGFVNIVGGCCGTTPDHIRGDRRGGRRRCRRGRFRRPTAAQSFKSPHTQFAGLETLTIRPDSNFQMIGERTNVTGSTQFARLIKAGDYAEAARRGARAGARRREHHRRQHGRRHARLRAGDDRRSSTTSPPSRRSRACRS